ncbi:MAG TPA: 3-deoxy-manno-octulosonate cytidylyltransferase [Thermoanaerobaculia bacterium]|nr:3-deoxy-manno-octulosonate cytidylyltransferase [Thermoanaerobaculia bacterium]
MNVIGVIPSRLASTRLPRKPLALIAGKAMVERVWEGARECAGLSRLLVATDAPEILEYCRARGIDAEMTSSQHVSGTDRIREIAARFPADVYVNVQGDEPMVTGAHVDALLRPFGRSEVAISTLALPVPPDAVSDPNTVKVVTRLDGRALYFSRSAIPFDRDGSGPEYRKHLGFYAYRRDALERFASLRPSPLELAERLEQLRFLENGIDIHVAEAPSDTWSVDTAEDLARVERHFRGR